MSKRRKKRMQLAFEAMRKMDAELDNNNKTYEQLKAKYKGTNNMSTYYTSSSIGTHPHDASEVDTCFAVKAGKRIVTFFGSKEIYALDNVVPFSDNALILNFATSGVTRPSGTIIRRNDLAPVYEKDKETNKDVLVSEGYDLQIFGMVKRFSEICIDTKDGGPPPVHPDFWLEIRKIIIKENFNKVICCCMGGHGRTGTALACLYLSFFDDDATRAIETVVRGVYCHKCVESNSQISYIEYVANYFDKLFAEAKAGSRLSPLKVTKLKREPKSTSSGGVTGSKESPKSTSSTSSNEVPDGNPALVCYHKSCNRRDSTVIDTEIDGKTLPECEECFMRRVEGPKENICATCNKEDPSVADSVVDGGSGMVTIPECSECWNKRKEADSKLKINAGND